MVDIDSYALLKREIAERMQEDYLILIGLRDQIRALRNTLRPIQPRNTTSIALVATDGGNNKLVFDPFLVQIVRVVDSSENELYVEVITSTTRVSNLSAKQFKADGTPATPLGELMFYLKIHDISQLSSFIPSNEESRPRNPNWTQVYRELVEWAVLFSLIRKKDFGTDTLIIFDGLLRSKVFAKDLFRKYLKGIYEGIEWQRQHFRRRIYLAGVAKHSQVFSRYRFAMTLEGVLTTAYPAYVLVPDEIEKSAYEWIEYTPGNRFVGGKMFFVKFGSSPRDPIWSIDILAEQVTEAQAIFGFMLADALNGFPIPYYPRCLQKAHEHAALIDFDFDILQNHIFDGIRQVLADEAPVLDTYRLQDRDISQRRY